MRDSQLHQAACRCKHGENIWIPAESPWLPRSPRLLPHSRAAKRGPATRYLTEPTSLTIYLLTNYIDVLYWFLIFALQKTRPARYPVYPELRGEHRCARQSFRLLQNHWTERR